MGIIDGQSLDPIPELLALPSRVVVKLRTASATPAAEEAFRRDDARVLGEPFEALRQATAAQGWRLTPYFTTADETLLSEAEDPDAAALAVRAVATGRQYYAVECPEGMDPAVVAQTVRASADVEEAYPEPRPAPPPAVTPGDDPLSVNQGYLDASPVGIDARWAWNEGGTDGSGVRLVDVEYGWTLNHEDLAEAAIPLVSGRNRHYRGHGTAVLGEIVGVDNQRGCVGIAPRAAAAVISQHRPDGSYNVADAILEIVPQMSAGDVLLIEAQSEHPTNSYVPVEISPAVRNAIKTAVARGIVVVECAGNGSKQRQSVGTDLDQLTDANGRLVFNRAHEDFQESGAILVGAGNSRTRERLRFSNFGSRVDCYAWGENIQTCGDGDQGNRTTVYTRGFGGTSGAAPIVAGAALLLQSARKRAGLAPYTPAEMKLLLTDTTLNTESETPNTDRIGVMPDLRKIIERERAIGALPPAPPAAPPAPLPPLTMNPLDNALFPRPVWMAYLALAALTAGNALLPIGAPPPPNVTTTATGPSVDFAAPGAVELTRIAGETAQTVVFVRSDDAAPVSVRFDAVFVDHDGELIARRWAGEGKVPSKESAPIAVKFKLDHGPVPRYWDARLPARGTLILTAKKEVKDEAKKEGAKEAEQPSTIRLRDIVVPQIQPAILELFVTLVSLIPALLLFVWAWLCSAEVTQTPPDSAPPWTPRSWSSNLAIGGALLTSLLGLAALPAHTHYMAKASYTVLSPFFAALIALAPAVYDLIKAGGTPTPANALRMFGAAAAITLWATLGQLGTAAFLFLELKAARAISGVAAVAAALVVTGVGIAVITYAFKAIATYAAEAAPDSDDGAGRFQRQGVERRETVQRVPPRRWALL